MNLVVIPCVDGFPELSLSAGEISTIIGSDLLYLAPSCNKPSERHQESISFQTVCHFNVYCSDSKTRENDPISLHKTSPTAYLKRTKTIDADRCKRRVTWGNTIHGKVSHFLLTKRALTPTATKALRKNFPDNRTCVYDPNFSRASPDQWRYVVGAANPGDCASRALTANALLSCQRWLLGPEFLWKSEEYWPRNPSSLRCLQDGDLEVKMVYKVCHASVSESEHPLVEYFQRASSWHRLKKSVAWFSRYRGNLQGLSKRGKSREPINSTAILSLPPITVTELEIAELEILRNVRPAV